MEVKQSAGAKWFPDDAAAAARFDALAGQLREEELQPQQEMLVADLVRGEGLKALLDADIAKRGVGGEMHNGRQRIWRENKSVATLMKLMDQQRRIMQALGLIARDASNQPRDDEDDDAFDEL